MRYLSAPNQFQLRLGWLSVAAALVNNGRLGRAQLEKCLLTTGLAKDGAAQLIWLEQAGIGPPQGKMSPRATHDIARMATVYGIYDADAQALTDLGQVLFSVTRWTPDVSPFLWRGAALFVGTRLLLGANGDVSLEILNRWPAGGELSSVQVPAFLAGCLERLGARAKVEADRLDLFAQADRAVDPTFHKRVLRELIYPHFEPLRELGYLSLLKKAGEYTITNAGRRFADASSGIVTDDFLRSGFASAFLFAQGHAAITPAGASAIRRTILELPSALLGAHAEAPLEPVVLLTQARLMEEDPGCWIDIDRAAALLGELERTTGGRIGLKAGRTPEEQNVTWRERANLDDAAMWQASVEVSVLIASPGKTPLPGEGDRPGKFSTVQPDPSRVSEALPAPIRAPAQTSPLSAPLSPPLRTGGVTPPPSKFTPHALLWLSYVERLLAPPELGDIGGIRRGGPVSWAAALRRLLDVPEDRLKMKRGPLDKAGGQNDKQHSFVGIQTVATSALCRWLHRLHGTSGVEAFAECTRLWGGMPNVVLPHPDEVRGALLWADRSAERLTASLVVLIRDFVQCSDSTIDLLQWEKVREATRGIVDDALHLGLWHAPELLGRLGILCDADPATAALELIGDLSVRVPSRSFSFTQEFRVPAALLALLDELDADHRIVSLEEATVEMSRSASLEVSHAGPNMVVGDDLSVSVALKARTPEQAMSRGAEYAAEAVSRLSFLATLRMLPGSAGDGALIAPEDGGRLTDEYGQPYKPPEEREVGVLFGRAEDLGFCRKRPIDSLLLGAVEKLPPLAAIDRGVALDGRARLARSLHWLALADTTQRPAERLSHGWVAFEHLFADGEQKGHLVAELAAPVVTLCFLRAAAGRLHRYALAALHIAACGDQRSGPLQGFVERWLGRASWDRYVERGAVSVVPFFEPRELADEEGLQVLLEKSADLKALAAVVEAHVPLVAWQLRVLDKLLVDRRELMNWLQQRRREATSFLMGIYEVRNQLVHDANPFGFDDTYRLRDLYEWYRVVINPVIAEVLCLVGADLAMPLKHAWALLRARYGELLAHQGNDKKNDPVDIKAVLGCFV